MYYMIEDIVYSSWIAFLHKVDLRQVADNILLLSSSVYDLQNLILICERELSWLDNDH